jgi:hypothetical protein
MSVMDTCNIVLQQALAVFSGSGGINAQLAALSLNPSPPPIASILMISAPMDVYEKTASVRYPVATIYCERLKNTQTEKFRMLSGTALLVVEIRVSGERAEDLETSLNSYVEAACQVLDASRGAWSAIGTYCGAYDVKFQAMRLGGKQFTKSAQIEFDIQVSN